MARQSEIWFVTGSQHLYGPEVLKTVAAHSQEIARSLDQALPATVVFKPVMTDPEAIRTLCDEANANPGCAGIILWNHTFSPAKMWIGGLTRLTKPVCHLHTQYNRELPWSSIDMDFMNLNQAAHGDREAGHLHTRINLPRKVVVGFWGEADVQNQLSAWTSVALAWQELQGLKVARFGDNMRQVAVTEGDKVSAEIKFGFSTNGFGVGDLVAVLNQVSDADVDRLCQEIEDQYDVVSELRKGGARYASLRDAAKQEIAMRTFLESGGFKAFTTTFEDLHGLKQLPGFACQRLMGDGYGFGAEGDWKTAALLRVMKVMGNMKGSFMEDYTYDLTPGKETVLGAHMLEICPTIAVGKPKVEIHPLGIGGKDDPVRLVFDAPAGPALNATLVDLGHRFRIIVNEVDAVEVPPMPNLPVARALWKVKPNFADGVAAWIYAGGAHHTVYSYTTTSDQVRTLADLAGVECVVIDGKTSLDSLRNELRWNDLAFR